MLAISIARVAVLIIVILVLVYDMYDSMAMAIDYYDGAGNSECNDKL